MKTVYRGEVYYAELSPVIGSEQGGIRPVLILQNNTGNRHSPTTIIAPITSVQKKSSLPTHIVIDYDFLESVSVVLLEQIRTIDKERLSDCLGRISVQDMQRVEAAHGGKPWNEVAGMTDKNCAALAYGLNLLRLLRSMALISEVEYQRIFRLQVKHYDPQKKLCLVP